MRCDNGKSATACIENEQVIGDIEAYVLNKNLQMLFPPDLGFLHWLPGAVELIKTDDVFTHYRIGGGPVVDGRQWFKVCYRTRICPDCKVEKLSDHFDWKVAGVEGPFREAWGKRDAWCKPCRSEERSARYKRRKRMHALSQRASKSRRVHLIDHLTFEIIESKADPTVLPVDLLGLLIDLVGELLIGDSSDERNQTRHRSGQGVDDSPG